MHIGHFFLLLKPRAFAAGGYEDSLAAILADLRRQHLAAAVAIRDGARRQGVERWIDGVSGRESLLRYLDDPSPIVRRAAPSTASASRGRAVRITSVWFSGV